MMKEYIKTNIVQQMEQKEPKNTKQGSIYKVKEENINKMHEYLKKQSK